MIILASQSPRRSEILRNAGLPFEVRRASVDESVQPHEPPEKYVKRIAQAKAMAVKAGPAEIVLGADTVVVIDGQIMGKPKDPDDALRMLVREQEQQIGPARGHGGIAKGSDITAGASRPGSAMDVRISSSGSSCPWTTTDISVAS